jgi:hypothetical protein
MAYIEKDKRHKLESKVQRTIYLGMSPAHSDDRVKLMSLKTMKVIYRRNVHFNERSYPARKQKLQAHLNSVDTGEDLIGLQFEDEGEMWTITEQGTHDDDLVLWYTNNKIKEEEKSSVKEVRSWYNRTQLNQASTHITQTSNSITATRKGFVNTLAETTFKTIREYDTKLPNKNVRKPTGFKKAGNSEHPQWFQAEMKEKDGMLNFRHGKDLIRQK